MALVNLHKDWVVLSTKQTKAIADSLKLIQLATDGKNDDVNLGIKTINDIIVNNSIIQDREVPQSASDIADKEPWDPEVSAMIKDTSIPED